MVLVCADLGISLLNCKSTNISEHNLKNRVVVLDHIVSAQVHALAPSDLNGPPSTKTICNKRQTSFSADSLHRHASPMPMIGACSSEASIAADLAVSAVRRWYHHPEHMCESLQIIYQYTQKWVVKNGHWSILCVRWYPNFRSSLRSEALATDPWVCRSSPSRTRAAQLVSASGTNDNEVEKLGKNAETGGFCVGRQERSCFSGK